MDNISDLIKERMAGKIEEIENFFSDLQKIIEEDSELNKTSCLHGSAMLLFSIINSAIDIADDIKFLKKFGKTNKYIEIFSLLKDNKLITEETYYEMSYLIDNRNYLAHEYGKISKENIKEIADRINVVYDIIALAKKTSKSKN